MSDEWVEKLVNEVNKTEMHNKAVSDALSCIRRAADALEFLEPEIKDRDWRKTIRAMAFSLRSAANEISAWRNGEDAPADWNGVE